MFGGVGYTIRTRTQARRGKKGIEKKKILPNENEF